MILLQSVTVRHERRIRLGFTVALAGGAFNASLYRVTSIDGLGVSPLVTKVYAVANSPHFVEIQLGDDLVQGGLYQVEALSVPGVDATTTPTPSAEKVRVGRGPEQTAATPARGLVKTIEAKLYGRDLARSGGDLVETQSGDLALYSGAAVLEADLTAALLSNGLPWDASYGLKAYEEVDGAPGALSGLRGRAVAVMRRDDRVSAASCQVDLSDPSEPVVTVEVKPIGAELSEAARALSLRVNP